MIVCEYICTFSKHNLYKMTYPLLFILVLVFKAIIYNPILVIIKKCNVYLFYYIM